MPQRVVRLVLLALILIILGSLKLSFHSGEGPYGLDGSNYFQVARNVAEGRGLVSSVSLYYAGFKKLPARSFQIYPLWPLILGHTGRLIGMARAADVLSKLFYFLSLVMAYFAANAIARGAIGRVAIIERWPSFDFGHVAVLLLGTNALFFMATSYPYTEGISFALMFAAIAVLWAPPAPGFWRGAAAGALAGLALLARTQMILIGPAAVVCLALVSLRDRRLVRAAIGCAAAFGISFLYWYYGIYGVGGERADVPGFSMWVNTPDWQSWLADRWQGLLTSFDPWSPVSYFHLFGPAAALPLIAALAAVVWWVARSRRISFHLSAEQVPMLVALSSGLMFLGILYNYHETFFLPWLFGYRHGLPYLLLILVAIPWLMTNSSRILRVVTVVCVLATIVLGVDGVVAFVTSPPPAGPKPSERQLSAWLDHQPRAVTLASTNAQTLATWNHANYHWLLCDDKPAQLRTLLAKLPIDYVVVYDAERGCPMFKGLGDVLTPAASFGDGRDKIWLLRPKTPPRE
ncbi:MAG: hypothetical protein QOC81_4037 [Thermoanaerobaculia bacterium]|jgi:hypothetical protein|nr:hypothetical protein [Thermoanaerobaculia bacterium]